MSTPNNKISDSVSLSASISELREKVNNALEGLLSIIDEEIAAYEPEMTGLRGRLLENNEDAKKERANLFVLQAERAEVQKQIDEIETLFKGKNSDLAAVERTIQLYQEHFPSN